MKILKTYDKIINCDNCDKEVLKNFNFDESKNPKNRYCCVQCKKAHNKTYFTPERRIKYSEMSKGENNANYNKRWSSEQKEAFSKKCYDIYANNEERRYKCGNANRGKKFSKERIHNMFCNRIYVKRPKMSDETKSKIGLKSSQKFTVEFKAKFKKTMILKGHWIADENKSPYLSYAKDANWISNMFNFANALEISNIKTFGLFSKNNSHGCVRDHIVSRLIGFEFNIPYQILRHPANMQILTHSQNVSKGFKERKYDKATKIEIIKNLFYNIMNNEYNWKEHTLCVSVIKELMENNNDYIFHRGFTPVSF